MTKKIVKVGFCIPNEGHTEPEAYDNRMMFCQHLGALQVLSSMGLDELDGHKFVYPKDTKFEFYVTSIGKVFTALAREKLADEAVESGLDYIMMIDDDMITDMDFFERLYAHNVDIVAGLAFTRSFPHSPVIYEVKKGYDPIARKNYYINYTLYTYPKDTLVECDAVGFGGVLIKTAVLKGMKKPWFMTTSGAGEDIHFCHMAKEQGFKVFMDTSVKMGHIGYAPIITEKEYEDARNMEELRRIYGDRSRCPK